MFSGLCRSSVLGPSNGAAADAADKAGGQPNGQPTSHPVASAAHQSGLELSPAMAAVALVSSVGQNDVLGGSPTTGGGHVRCAFLTHSVKACATETRAISV